jgi:hypothetical protein
MSNLNSRAGLAFLMFEIIRVVEADMHFQVLDI